MRRSPVAVAATLSVLVALPTMAVGPAGADEPHESRAGSQAPSPSTTATVQSVDQGWWRGSDLMVEGHGSEDGYTVYLARESERYVPRPIATIRPDGNDADTWLGYTCVTGDGRHAVVNVAQRWTTNRAALRDRGGLLYSVALDTGAVKPIASGVAFKYHAVGCGAGSDIAFVRHLGIDQEESEVYAGRVGGALSLVAKRAGQITAPVPVGQGVMALRGRGIVELSGGTERVVARADGEPFQLRANRVGTVDLLVLRKDDVRVARLGQSGLATLATGEVGRTRLDMGRGGRTFATGPTRQRRGVDGFDVLAAVPNEGVPAGTSLEGKVVLADAPKPSAEAKAAASARPGGARHYVWGGTGEQLRIAPPSGPAAELADALPQALGSVTDGGSTKSSTPTRAGAMTEGDATSGESVTVSADNTPTCGVPRNSPTRQAYSSTHTQSDWAVQMGSRNLLKDSFSRPPDYLKSGLPAYSPSNDFPVPALQGQGGHVAVPVMNGVLAQESAYRHASRRTLPGNGGNPLVGDYYGAAGTIDRIDYSESDCGYGIAQVTSGMRTSETSISPNGKAKVAIDYAENIQAGLNILAKKWNQLYNAGITFNDSQPVFAENWYTALWAYNSGVQPTAQFGNTTGCTPSPTCTDPHGHWGLGWTNNPLNPDYPPDRSVFLRATYADAERPGDWPYQERVLGFAETPIFTYKGESAYQSANQVSYPPRDTFCNASNECDPALENPSDPSLSYCTRADNHCWWHEPVTTPLVCSASPHQCSSWSYTAEPGSAEPGGENPWPPACNSDLGPNAIIVDELPDPSKNLFCPSRDWTNQGSFSYEVGTVTAADGSQLPLGEIDFHQIATGLGSHVWFAGNRLASDTSHRVTGTWSPDLPSTGPYAIQVHIPRRGSGTTSAEYKVTLADGTTTTKSLDQHEHYDHWKLLGVYNLGPGSKVQLSNVTGETDPGSVTVAFDAMAFVPAPGTLKRTTIEAVAFFDEDTNIDADPLSRMFTGSVLETRQRIYDWANGLTSRVLSYPECDALGVIRADQCIRPATRRAFQRWAVEVTGAGSGNAITTWIGFANPNADRPKTPLAPGAFRTDDSAYKIRNQVTLSYVLNNGSIVPGTQDASYDDRTADTHLPRFLREIMQAIETDYGVTMPNMAYSKVDLNEYDHQVRDATPNEDGILPGQALPQVATKATVVGSCVKGVHTSGGGIGYRPMLATKYVPAAVEGWKNRVEDQAGWYPDGTLAKFANDVYETFFQQVDNLPTGAAFNAAPPIWQEVNVQYCADGTVKPGITGGQILRQSFMPDAYLYRDGQAIGNGGAQRLSADPLFRGNFDNFTTIRQLGAGPYGDCDTDTYREGNPWGRDVPAPTDDHPSRGHFCFDKNVTSDSDG